MTVLAARALHVSLAGRPVLHGVNATFAPGWTAVVGPNGAGKTTLLRALAGLLAPQGGQIELDGAPLTALSARERARRLAWLAQTSEPSGEQTVQQTVALGRLPHLGLLAAPGPADAAAIAAAMAATGCADWAARRLTALSGGERQRVLLARALATEAPVLLLDEPTAHLDMPHQVALARWLRGAAATRTVVAIVHDLSLALAADRVLLLAAGRVQAEGASHEPALHRAIEAAFDHAVRIGWHGGGWTALPRYV